MLVCSDIFVFLLLINALNVVIMCMVSDKLDNIDSDIFWICSDGCSAYHVSLAGCLQLCVCRPHPYYALWSQNPWAVKNQKRTNLVCYNEGVVLASLCSKRSKQSVMLQTTYQNSKDQEKILVGHITLTVAPTWEEVVVGACFFLFFQPIDNRKVCLCSVYRH